MDRIRCIAALCAAALSLSAARAQDPSEKLHALFAEQYEWRKHEFPEWALAQGDDRFADRIADSSLEAIERRHEQTIECRTRLRSIHREGLSEQDQLYYDLFDKELSDSIDGHRFRMYLAPLTGRDGPHHEIPQMHLRSPFRNEADYENFLKRLEQTPQWLEDTVALLKLGAAEGRTPPKASMQGVPQLLDTLLAAEGLNSLREPFAHIPDSIPPDRAAALRRQLDEKTLPAIRAALTEYRDYVVGDYLPKLRDSIAATDLPDGEAYYAYMLRVMTTTDYAARDIHEIGLREVARIHAEMLDVIRASDFLDRRPEARQYDDKQLFPAFIEYLRTDPRFYHKSADELLDAYRAVCKKIDATLPQLFGRLPRLPYGVRPIPDFAAPTQTTAYYFQGDIRAGQAGYFYANTYALDQRPKYEMVALAMHEAVPGHHLQIALAQEMKDVPDFRKEAWVNAFGEGWALYSERLGLEVGLYEDPYDNFGRLLYEMWRACRLVVDPGMHALGWSREKAIRFMLDNTALSELNIRNEIDRYINWPGQATAYKIGELKIRELRARAERKLGDAFDLRQFHDVVLGAGVLPLDLLERRVDAWVDAKRAAPH